MKKSNEKYMLKKDLKLEIRSVRVLVFIVILNVILAVSTAVAFYSIFSKDVVGYAVGYKSVLHMYNTSILVEYIVVLCIVPIIAGTSIAKEYETGTMELLLLTNIRTKDIVMSKINKVFYIHLFFVISTLPMLSVVFSVGTVSIFDILKYVLVISSSILFFGSIGLYFSTKKMKRNIAVLYTYIVEIVCTLGNYVVVAIIYNLVDKISNSAFYSGAKNAVYHTTQIKILGDLLVTNPIFSIFRLQRDVEGATSSFSTILGDVGVSGIVVSLWIPISILLQVGAAIVIISKTKKIMKKRHRC